MDFFNIEERLPLGNTPILATGYYSPIQTVQFMRYYHFTDDWWWYNCSTGETHMKDFFLYWAEYPREIKRRKSNA